MTLLPLCTWLVRRLAPRYSPYAYRRRPDIGIYEILLSGGLSSKDAIRGMVDFDALYRAGVDRPRLPESSMTTLDLVDLAEAMARFHGLIP
jgi:hypothetical protein